MQSVPEGKVNILEGRNIGHSKQKCIRGPKKFANSPPLLAVAAVDRNLSMVWWRWHISVSKLCCCWSMAVSFWVASFIILVCFGVLHHDDAPAHTILSVREFLASRRITVLENPPYSPDLASSGFFLFPKIKEILKGRHFSWTQL
jgi:hypothetical protein